MKTRGRYVYKGTKCPKCSTPDLIATIDAGRLLVTLECSKCFARKSNTVTRADALKAIAERDAMVTEHKHRAV